MRNEERKGRRAFPRHARWAVPWPVLLLAAACAGGRGAAPDAAPAPEPAAGPGDRAVAAAAGDTVAAGARPGEAKDTSGVDAAGESERPAGHEAPRDSAAAPPDAEVGPEASPADEAESGTEPGAPGSGALAVDPEGDGGPLVLPVPILPGALLPGTRIVAFYGNPASKRMGILGELPPDEMLGRLDAEVRAWREADPSVPVRSALQMIAVMATGDPGRDSLFRLRMPEARIRQVASWAERRNALLFLDIQPGHSTVAAELPRLEKWLARPDVHLALDPEWAMPPGVIPGRRIGSLDATDINSAIDFLADVVDRYHLPPKILVVHRFTESMVTDAGAIRRDPRVQVVLNMDGWGSPPHKKAAYRDVVAPDADQFTGFKLFFHNDRRDGSPLLTPEEILDLEPRPVYIQYQ